MQGLHATEYYPTLSDSQEDFLNFGGFRGFRVGLRRFYGQRPSAVGGDSKCDAPTGFPLAERVRFVGFEVFGRSGLHV